MAKGKGKKKKSTKKKVLTEEEKAELEARKLEAEEAKVKPPTFGWIKLTVSPHPRPSDLLFELQDLMYVTDLILLCLVETCSGANPLIQLL